jgi:hypothetical protein
LHEIKEQALPSIIEMAAWKDREHAHMVGGKDLQDLMVEFLAFRKLSSERPDIIAY